MPAQVITNFPADTAQFTAPEGAPIDDAFFREVFADRMFADNPQLEVYKCNLVDQCTMSTWLEAWGGHEYDCNPNIDLLEYGNERWQIKITTGVTVPAFPGTVVVTLDAEDVFAGYILPRKGNTLVLPPVGVLADITAVSLTGSTYTLTIQQRGSTAIILAANQELMVIPASLIEDCDCPEGQMTLPGLPVESNLKMYKWGDKASLCGDALQACIPLRIPFLDANDNEITGKTPWFTGVQSQLYQKIERRKHYERLFNQDFGLIPTLLARATMFKPASPTEITLTDIREFKKAMNSAGVMKLEYAVFAGNDIFSQFQQLAIREDVKRIELNNRPLQDCKWVDLNYCGISVEGVTFHLYEECTFSNGKELGSPGFDFTKSAIMIPMTDRPIDTIRRGSINRSGNTTKMLTTVYFQSIQGLKYDMRTDAVGIIQGRNIFGAGCVQQDWTAETRFLQEIHCPERWSYIGLGT